MFKSCYSLPVLAVVGILAGIWFVVRGNIAAPVAQPVAQPAVAPFDSYIAGSGLMEASTRNIAISTPVGGVVAEVFVKVGDRVRKNQPLFRIDARDLEAQLAVRRAAAAAASAQTLEIEATLAQSRVDLGRAERLAPSQAISLQELANRRYNVQLNEAKLGTARANAGAAAIQISETEANIARLTIGAPVDGDILRINVQRGEYAQTGALSSPLVLMGDTQTLHGRVDIDENDAWRFRPGMRAKGFLRGNSAVAFDMKFAYIEPYVVPKTALTGASTERVDTRVLQVIFTVSKGDLPIYVGQQVDVYLETSANHTTPDLPPVRPELPIPTTRLSPSLVDSTTPAAAASGRGEN